MGEVSAIIVAAGRGRRMGTDIGKQFLPLMGKPVLNYCLEVFEACSGVDDIVLVVDAKDLDYTRELLRPYGYRKLQRIVVGGAERQHSVYKGLLELKPDTDIVLVHDGVRPFVSPSILEESIRVARESGCSVAGVPAKDTIKIVDDQGYAVATPDRRSLWLIQTPQTFRYEILLQAHEKAREENFLGTDDAMLVERLGIPVKMIMGSYENIKITTSEDMALGEIILAKRGKI
ncbi:MAG: 2-C-methyl-D-erythritol 4-phosphate cytidylyltransferase [Clostridia bacterium]|jgi:2-C-methyl-D-erythritol 4-phosphate cytidylyltransferase